MRIVGGLFVLLGLAIVLVPACFEANFVYSQYINAREIPWAPMLTTLAILFCVGLLPFLGGLWLIFKKRPGQVSPVNRGNATPTSANAM